MLHAEHVDHREQFGNEAVSEDNSSNVLPDSRRQLGLHDGQSWPIPSANPITDALPVHNRVLQRANDFRIWHIHIFLEEIQRIVDELSVQ